MPYIIETTTRRGKVRQTDCRTGWQVVTPDGIETYRRAESARDAARSVTRHAVATLEERSLALHLAIDHLEGDAYLAAAAQLDAMPESGGTIGPLPDGTVIKVRQVHWPRLAELANYQARVGEVGQAELDGILAAYNA